MDTMQNKELWGKERLSYLPPVLKIRSALGAPFGCWYRGRRSRLVFAGAGRWARDCSISGTSSKREKVVNSGKCSAPWKQIKLKGANKCISSVRWLTKEKRPLHTEMRRALPRSMAPLIASVATPKGLVRQYNSTEAVWHSNYKQSVWSQTIRVQTQLCYLLAMGLSIQFP